MRRVLLAIGGHIGDAILATGSLDLLRALAPDAEIGVVLPSWSRAVFSDDPRVARIHIVDHWRVNRAPVGMAARTARYAETARQAIREIREQAYDVAVDLYPFYPNMAGVLWRAGVARRFGFASGGRGPLFTDALSWPSDERHMAARQATLIRLAAGAPAESDATPISAVPAPPAEARARTAALLAERGVAGSYVVLHAGSGLRKKEWSGEAWRALAARLAERGVRIVLTGAGDAERLQADRIAAGIPRCVTLVGQLDWQGLCAVVSGASAVVSGDTSVAHLAAARGTSRVVIFSGINSTHEWHPVGGRGAQLMLQHPVPCAPCYRRDGCAAMTCVNGVTVDDVVAALDTLLDGDRRDGPPPSLSRVDSVP